MAKKAFAVVAHPDDIEFLMAGTMILLGRAGYELHYMTIANGSCGTAKHDPTTIIRIRRDEAKAVAVALNAHYHESLVNDLEIYYEKSTLTRLASVMRAVAPEILLTHSPVDYMEDHQNAARLAVTAAFARCIPNFMTEPPKPRVDQDVTVYHAQPHGNVDPFGEPVRPGLFVDISDVMEEKAAALALHKSQKDWLDKSQGMDSYVNTMKELSREVGKMSGAFEYAEGFRRRNHIGFCAKGADPLALALQKKCLKSR